MCCSKRADHSSYHFLFHLIPTLHLYVGTNIDPLEHKVASTIHISTGDCEWVLVKTDESTNRCE